MSENSRTELSQRQARYVALRATMSQGKAAAAVGVHDRTARTWEHQPAVKVALRTQRDLLLAEAAGRSTALTLKALDVIEAVLDDKDASQMMRLNAARIVLSARAELAEHHDLAERMRAIEEAIDEQNQQPTLSR